MSRTYQVLKMWMNECMNEWCSWEYLPSGMALTCLPLWIEKTRGEASLSLWSLVIVFKEAVWGLHNTLDSSWDTCGHCFLLISAWRNLYQGRLAKTCYLILLTLRGRRRHALQTLQLCWKSREMLEQYPVFQYYFRNSILEPTWSLCLVKRWVFLISVTSSAVLFSPLPLLSAAI